MNKYQQTLYDKLNALFETESEVIKYTEKNKDWFDDVVYYRLKDKVRSCKEDLIYSLLS